MDFPKQQFPEENQEQDEGYHHTTMRVPNDLRQIILARAKRNMRSFQNEGVMMWRELLDIERRKKAT